MYLCKMIYVYEHQLSLNDWPSIYSTGGSLSMSNRQPQFPCLFALSHWMPRVSWSSFSSYTSSSFMVIPWISLDRLFGRLLSVCQTVSQIYLPLGDRSIMHFCLLPTRWAILVAWYTLTKSRYFVAGHLQSRVPHLIMERTVLTVLKTY